MILSMTGFGKSEGEYNKKKYSIEMKSLNNRFCEISLKYPKYLTSKDNDIKEIIKNRVARGKVYLLLTVESGTNEQSDLVIDKNILKEYLRLLKSMRKEIGSKEKIKLEHILHFSEILSAEASGEVTDEEFKFIKKLIEAALDDLSNMKQKEGDFIKNDIMKRIELIDSENEKIKITSAGRVPAERIKLREKVDALIADKSKIDENRLELELIFLSEKIDITEECTRLNSHLKYFTNCVESEDNAGRRLNFLLQEMNREINTMASKSLDAEISQRVSVLKEELEKIREQIQNVE
jgi:uncharacterized protein (TIGR00255 family)